MIKMIGGAGQGQRRKIYTYSISLCNKSTKYKKERRESKGCNEKKKRRKSISEMGSEQAKDKREAQEKGKDANLATYSLRAQG